MEGMSGDETDKKIMAPERCRAPTTLSLSVLWKPRAVYCLLALAEDFIFHSPKQAHV